MKTISTTSTTNTVERDIYGTMDLGERHKITENAIRSANNKILARIKDLEDSDLKTLKEYVPQLLAKYVMYGNDFGKLCWQYLNKEITWDEVKEKIKQIFAYGISQFKSNCSDPNHDCDIWSEENNP